MDAVSKAVAAFNLEVEQVEDVPESIQLYAPDPVAGNR